MTRGLLHSPLPFRPRITFVGAICICFSLWGCLAIYNATCHLSPPHWFVGRQLIWLLCGALALAVASGAPESTWRRVLPYVAIPAYMLLWLVLVYGVRINGMKGWFSCRGVFMQPSELGKPVFVLVLAAVAERTRARRGEWLHGYAPLLAVLLLWAVPIALQPDFGCLAVYALAFLIVCWCAGVRGLHLGVTVLAAIPACVLIAFTCPYVQRRLAAFVRPEAYAQTAGWHVLQLQRSLASGGLTGRVWGQSAWPEVALPFAYSDSIFARTAEAVGFVGVLPIIAAVLAWVVYGHRRAARAGTDFSSIAILGLTCIVAGQAFIHLGVNLGLLPATGITLPLISYGGSSLLATLACIGIVEGLSSPVSGPAPQLAQSPQLIGAGQ